MRSYMANHSLNIQLKVQKHQVDNDNMLSNVMKEDLQTDVQSTETRQDSFQQIVDRTRTMVNPVCNTDTKHSL